MRSLTPFFLCLALACGGSDDKSDTTTDAADADTDTDTDSDTDTDTDTDTDPNRVPVDFALVDLLTTNEVEGVVVTSAGDSDTTDADGMARVTVDLDADYEITGTHEDYYDHVWVGYGGAAHTHATNILSRSGGGLLATLLGLKLDPSRGVIVVTILGPDGLFLEGTTVTPDVGFDVALVPDDTETSGFAAGNTTLAGNTAWVVFINVDPGDVMMNIETVDPNLTCYFGGGGPAADWAVSRADSVTNMAVRCE